MDSTQQDSLICAVRFTVVDHHVNAQVFSNVSPQFQNEYIAFGLQFCYKWSLRADSGYCLRQDLLPGLRTPAGPHKALVWIFFSSSLLFKANLFIFPTTLLRESNVRATCLRTINTGSCRHTSKFFFPAQSNITCLIIYLPLTPSSLHPAVLNASSL